MTPDDRTLHTALLERRRLAWVAFVASFSRMIYALIRRTAARHMVELTREDVADLHQDVLVALLDRDMARLRAWSPEGRRLSSWVGMVARQTAVEAFRSGARRPRTVHAPDAFQPPADTPPPDAVADARQQLAGLAEVACTMTSRQQRVLTDYYGGGLRHYHERGDRLTIEGHKVTALLVARHGLRVKLGAVARLRAAR